MTQPKQIIVIGAGYAGMLATIRLAGKIRRVNAQITLINAADTFVERMRLHQLAAGQVIKPRPIADQLRGTGTQFVQGVVTAIDPTNQRISVNMAGETRRFHYDKLLYALGSSIDRQTVPGAADYAYTLTPSGERAAPALRQALLELAQSGGQVVIGGGGATGIETAAELADAYPNLRIHLVTRGDLGLFLGKPVAAYIRHSLTQRHVTIHDHTTITAVQADQIITADDRSIPHDICLWTGGFTVPGVARDSGLAVNERGQILIDPFMRSISHPDIYAVGDAAYPVEEPGVPMRMSAFTAAITGAHGADCLAAALRGQTPRPLSFAYLGQGIALGWQNAVGFNNYPNDKPNWPHFTGRAGYEIREFFVRFLADLPAWERRIPGFFYWLGKGRYAAQKRRAGSPVRAGRAVVTSDE